MRRTVFKVTYLLFPLATIVLISPFLSVLFIDTRYFIHSMLNGDEIMLALLPGYLGLMAAPGYIYLLVSEPKKKSTSVAKQMWLRLSLVTAILCSLYGTICIGPVLPFLRPLSAVVLIMCTHLLIRFETTGATISD